MQATSASKRTMAGLGDLVTSNGQGFLVAAVVAVAAQFLSDHYGAPAMLMALLLGIAFHFLSEEGACKPGIDFTARTVLRFGVALLGARISVELIVGLGPQLIFVVIAAVILTLLFGLVAARLLGRGWRFGLLTGGSVAICGASAAMAISAVLPKNEHSERNLIFTVLSVTVLSTVAMIAYPILTDTFAFNDEVSGVFLGGTIHDVAQVVGAGFSVSDEAGEVATLVKLIRVAMLAPVVLVISVLVRRNFASEMDGKRPPVLPVFVIGFLVFAAFNSFGLIPDAVVSFLSSLSRWALLISIAAVGMKTSLRRILDVGGQAIALIVAETVFIAGFVLLGVAVLGH
ncbi:YeiH family protein [Marinovum algicola]|uniref:YeiH family protein n=1 Tax=Marinovum algicola TaxID=42444 RepID=UPI0024BBB7BF|nr:YeiH family protein [Marinovum algicola]